MTDILGKRLDELHPRNAICDAEQKVHTSPYTPRTSSLDLRSLSFKSTPKQWQLPGEPCRRPFDSLPDELLVSVFEQLPLRSVLSVLLVCRRFSNIILGCGQLFRRVSLREIMAPGPHSRDAHHHVDDIGNARGSSSSMSAVHSFLPEGSRAAPGSSVPLSSSLPRRDGHDHDDHNSHRQTIMSILLNRVIPACGSGVREMNLSYHVDVVDAHCVAMITRHCHQLRSLSLSGLRSLSSTDLYRLIKANAGTPGIDLTVDPKAGSRSPVRGCYLTRLELANVKCVDDRTLIRLAGFLPHLTHIDLSTFLTKCAFTDRGLTRLIRCCPRLTDIRLVHCTLLSDLSLLAIAARCSGLKSLDIQGCFKFSDVGVSPILRMAQLENINMNYVWRITDNSLSGAAAPSLRCLHAEFCYQLTDLFVDYASRSPHLQCLSVAHCSSISEAAIDRVNARLPKAAVFLHQCHPNTT